MFGFGKPKPISTLQDLAKVKDEITKVRTKTKGMAKNSFFWEKSLFRASEPNRLFNQRLYETELPATIEVADALACLLIAAETDFVEKEDAINKKHRPGWALVKATFSHAHVVVSPSPYTVGKAVKSTVDAFKVADRHHNDMQELLKQRNAAADKVLENYRLAYVAGKFVLQRGEWGIWRESTYNGRYNEYSYDLKVKNTGFDASLTDSPLVDKVPERPSSFLDIGKTRYFVKPSEYM